MVHFLCLRLVCHHCMVICLFLQNWEKKIFIQCSAVTRNQKSHICNLFNTEMWGMLCWTSSEQWRLKWSRNQKDQVQRVTNSSGAAGITSEISVLRSNLDDSLYNVSGSAARTTHEMRQSLERETNRLRQTTDQFHQQQTSPNQQYKSTAAQKIRRNLSFDNLDSSSN